VPANPCAIPPGRLNAVMTCLPVIPPGLADDFLASNTWPQGIQKGLEETKDCPWAYEMPQWTTSSVVIRGQVVRLTTPVRGALPWGWYRWPVGAPVATDPVATVAWLRDVLRAPLTALSPLATGTPSLRAQADASPCVVPVPDVDVLVPYPFVAPWSGVIGGRTWRVHSGDLGRLVWRIPGSGSSLFSTGLGIQYVVPDFLTELGRQFFAERAASMGGYPQSALQSMFGRIYTGPTVEVSPYAYTRDYQVSHMQCLTPLHYASLQEVRWRWLYGGVRPAAFTLDAHDAFEVETSPGSGLWINNALALSRYARDAQGRSLIAAAPEYPFGAGQVNGAVPGSLRIS
jgi:hypothetical protein